MTNGFWMMDYAPTKNVIKLKFWPLKIALDSAWVECQWIEEANFLGSSLEKKNNGRFNIGFKIKSEATTDFVYSLDIIPDRLGSISAFNPLTKQHEGVLFQFPDTLKIIVQEKNSVDSISWIKHIATDTLIYVKCKNK